MALKNFDSVISPMAGANKLWTGTVHIHSCAHTIMGNWKASFM